MNRAEHVQLLNEVLHEVNMLRQLLLYFCRLLLRLPLNFVAIVNHTLFLSVFQKQLIEDIRVYDPEKPLLDVCSRLFGAINHFIGLIALFLDLLVL